MKSPQTCLLHPHDDHFVDICITVSGNILASGNMSLKLFMAPLEKIELLTFWYVVAEHHSAQL